MIRNLGKYIFMLYHIFFKPEKFSVYWRRFLDEVIQLGVKSLFIVSLMSAFMGAVLVIQTATAIESAWIPDYTVGFTIKQSMLLEFCPTIISLIHYSLTRLEKAIILGNILKLYFFSLLEFFQN